MSMDISEVIAAPNAKEILRTVLESPYIEYSALTDATGLTVEQLDAAVRRLTEKMVLLELASQADSSVESRVPKRVYIVNPEMEGAVRGTV